jgi:hypothetical protein
MNLFEAMPKYQQAADGMDNGVMPVPAPQELPHLQTPVRLPPDPRGGDAAPTEIASRPSRRGRRSYGDCVLTLAAGTPLLRRLRPDPRGGDAAYMDLSRL